MQRIQDKLLKAVECLEYFTMNQWQFRDENVRSLLTSLNANDRKTFDFDVCHIQWAQYIERYVLGFRKYLFKQKMDTLPVTRKQMTRLVVLEGEDGEWSNGTNVIFPCRLYWFDQVVKVLSVVFVWRFLMARSKRLRDVWLRFMHMAMQMVRLVPFL